MKEKLINVSGCFRCKKLAGDLRKDGQTRMRQGYEQCSCGADIDQFWLNLTTMTFQESRQVSLEEANELAFQIGGLITTDEFPPLGLCEDDIGRGKQTSWWKKPSKEKATA